MKPKSRSKPRKPSRKVAGGVSASRRRAAVKARRPPVAGPFAEHGVTAAEVERRARKEPAAIRKERAAGRLSEVTPADFIGAGCKHSTGRLTPWDGIPAEEWKGML